MQKIGLNGTSSTTPLLHYHISFFTNIVFYFIYFVKFHFDYELLNAAKGQTRLRNNTVSVHYGTAPRKSPRTFSASPIMSTSHFSSASNPHNSSSSSSSSSTAAVHPSLSGAPASLINAFSPPNSPKPRTSNSKDVLDPGFVFFHLRQMSSEKAKCMLILLIL